MTRIPIKSLEKYCREHRLSKGILFAHHEESGLDHVVTWGRTIEDCSQAADYGNLLKDIAGWPEALHQQPSRVRRIQRELAEAKAEIKRLKRVLEGEQ